MSLPKACFLLIVLGACSTLSPLKDSSSPVPVKKSSSPPDAAPSAVVATPGEKVSCDEAEFETACWATYELVVEHCDNAERLASDTERYVSRAGGHAKATKAAQQFEARWEQCFQSTGAARCRSPERYVRTCEKAAGQYIKTWKQHIARQEVLAKRRLESAEGYREAKSFRSAASSVRALQGEISAAVSTNHKMPAPFRADVAALVAIQSGLESQAVDLDGQDARTVADASCPPGSVQNKPLLGRFQPILKKEFRGGKGLVETIKEVRSDGKPYQQYDKVRLTTYENAQVIVCVEQKKVTATTCRSFTVTMRRNKPRGSTWSPWGRHSVGDAKRISCEGL